MFLSLSAAIFFVEGALHPVRRPFAPQDELLRQRLSTLSSDVTLSAEDGARLKAWSIRPQDGNNGNTVILLHGVGDNRLGMIGDAQLLIAHGYSVLMPNARAQGDSGGQLVTYGLLESEDIRRWYQWIQKNQHPDCIFGLGESMGAAQLLQALETESHFCAVVAESAFSTFREIAYDRIGQAFHTGPWLGRTLLRPVVEAAFLYSRLRYRLNFEQLAPERIVT